jgi:hypothetical protein
VGNSIPIQYLVEDNVYGKKIVADCAVDLYRATYEETIFTRHNSL